VDIMRHVIGHTPVGWKPADVASDSRGAVKSRLQMRAPCLAPDRFIQVRVLAAEPMSGIEAKSASTAQILVTPAVLRHDLWW
jgi:hypothetical protein